MLVFFESNHI